MKFDVITLFPDLIKDMTQVGVVGAAFKKGLLQLNLVNPRDFTSDVHRTVDDRPYGGGDGMVMLVDPLQSALDSLNLSADSSQRVCVVYLSPQGSVWNDQRARDFAKSLDRLTLISGRYGGIDERVLESNQIEEISIGDYVLSGGELAAGVLIDSIARHVPGVLGHKDSSDQESLARGVLEAPQYTRPVELGGRRVPDVLLSGDHQKIQGWREMMALLVTRKKRPDLFAKLELGEPRLKELDQFARQLGDAHHE